jgi:hypothetical protein
LTIQARIENALRSPQPVPSLRALVQDLAQEGKTRSEIYALLEKFLLERRTHPDFPEPEEDALLDVMDALTDSCHPSAALLRETN